MTEHIHSHTAPDGSTLLVSATRMRAWSPGSYGVAVPTPAGADAVALAQAFLAAAGDTGYELVRTDEIDAYRARSARGFQLTCEVRMLRAERDAAFEEGARSMRGRADDTVAQHWPRPGDERPSAVACADVRDAIAALPLLPDADDTPVYESPQELAEEITRLRSDRDDTECVLMRKVEALESEVRELHISMEHQGRDIEGLRADMGQAQAAIRGVGQSDSEIKSVLKAIRKARSASAGEQA